MPKPRKSLISLDATPYYHCVARCVRRAFLCGLDQQTGADYEHRRGWIEHRILELTQVFALDVCAYAVMSNHYHIVLHINAEQAESWTTEEVITRWHSLFKGTLLTHKYLEGTFQHQAELTVVEDLATAWRAQLMDISWFMRLLNEHIARQANSEDKCTGRFWEGRFKSQALLDEKALAACLAYVDLNPIRAKMADCTETSNYTSAQMRIESAKICGDAVHANQPGTLFPFVGNPRHNMPVGLPFRLQDYLELLDWTGRQLRPGKRGAIDTTLPPILERLNIDAKNWLYTASHFESAFKGFVGSVQSLVNAAQTMGYRRTLGLTTGQLLS